MAFYPKLRDLLLESGLSEAETLVYIELLKKPANTIWDLVKRTNLSKSVVYRAFEKLKILKMAEKTHENIRALSLKGYVAEILRKERKLRKSAFKIKQIAPFLHAKDEAIEEFQTCYTTDQIIEAYLFMSQGKYNVNLDFGDFENFIPTIGGLPIGFQFRNNRVKRAGHHAITTTFGSNTAYFCTKEAEKEYKNKCDVLNIDFKNQFIIFSDNEDYVLFNNFESEETQNSVLVKSKAIADMERARFKYFSRQVGNV